jgi:hypothetical protein
MRGRSSDVGFLPPPLASSQTVRMMHRVPALLLQTSRQTALSSSRHIATSSILLAKGRKTIRYPPPAQAPTSPGQEGDDVGRARPANVGGLFEGEVGQEKVEKVTPDSIEKEMLASQGSLKKQLDGEGERENLAGTDVGQGGGTEKISTGSAAGEKGEYGTFTPSLLLYLRQWTDIALLSSPFFHPP